MDVVHVSCHPASLYGLHGLWCLQVGVRSGVGAVAVARAVHRGQSRRCGEEKPVEMIVSMDKDLPT